MRELRFEFNDSFASLEKFLKAIQGIQNDSEKTSITVFLKHEGWPVKVTYPDPTQAALGALKYTIDEINLYLKDLICIEVRFQKEVQ